MTENWKSFVVGDLFKISRPMPRTHSKYNDGNVAFVASGNFNNGVTKWCNPKDEEILDKGNCITVSPLDGSAFYQKKSFLGRGGAGSAILILRNENLNEFVGLFLSSIYHRTLTKYTYADQLNSQSILEERIYLPADLYGEPDWKYISKFMAAILIESRRRLKYLREINDKKHFIDTRKWEAFTVGELFPSIVKPPVLHARQVKETDEGIPYVVRTKFNNGIKYRVYPVADVTPSPADVITWGAENATFFYQSEEFFSGRDIYYVDTRAYSANTCMFLATCLQTVVHRYPYNYGLFPNLLKEEQIRLPVDTSGVLDWKYMDEFIQTIIDNTQTDLSAIQEIV